MKKEQKPDKRESKKSPGFIRRIFRKIGALATSGIDGLQENMESGAADSKGQVERVVTQLTEIERGEIKHGERRQLRFDEQNTLAKVERSDGSRIDLLCMLVAGYTVFGVVRTSIKEGEGYKVDEVSVVELPYGHNREFNGQDNSPVRVIGTMKPEELVGKQLPNGTIDERKEVAIGRGDGVSTDEALSNTHVRLTFRPDKLVIEDGSRDKPSTNGTFILGYEQGLAALESKKIVGATPVEKLVNVAQDYPTTWDPSLAGHTVISPDGPQR